MSKLTSFWRAGLFLCLLMGVSAKPAKASDDKGLDNSVSIRPVTIAPGSTAKLAVELSNVTAFTAFQFNIILPEGITVASDDFGYLVELSNRGTLLHNIDGNFLSTGEFCVTSFSGTQLLNYTGNSGVICYITIQADDNLRNGEYDVSMETVKFSEYVNDDETVGHLLENTTGTITVAAVTIPKTDSRLEILPFTVSADDKTTVTMDLTNPNTDFTAFECNLSLPEGIAINVNKKGRPQVSFNSDEERTDNTIHDLTCSINADKSYSFSCQPKEGDVFDGKEGAIVDIPLTVDADMPDGVYEFVVSDILLTTEDEIQQQAADYHGTIIVGNGGSVKDIQLKGYYTKAVMTEFAAALADNVGVTSIDMTEAVDIDTKGALTTGNPNTLLYIAEGKAVANAQNVVAGDECASLVLTDGYAFHAPKAFTAAEASYSRSVATDGWYSLCLPFAAETPAGVAVERFVSLDEAGGTATFGAGTVAADQPCIFNAKAGTVTFSASNTAVAATPATLTDGQMAGTYTGMAAGTIEGSYALRSDGTGFGRCDATAYATPFRAVMNAAGGASMIKAVHDDSATGISAASQASEGIATGAFTLSGQRVAQPRRGIYIVNGKKTLIK